MSPPVEVVCSDRSFAWASLRTEVGYSEERACILTGIPDVSLMSWHKRRLKQQQSFHHSPLGGIYADTPVHGWSFITPPGKNGQEYKFFC